MLFGGKLKNFFDWLEADYLNHLDWKFFVAVLALLAAIALFRFMKKAMRCPECGGKLFLHVHDDEQFDRWFCDKYGFEEIRHFN
jgi:ribosomal protein S27AE